LATGTKPSWTTAATFGAALAAIALGVAPLFEGVLVRGALIGTGLVVLAARLITLQLRYYREGDGRWSAETRRQYRPPTRPAPAELRNPRFRAVWEHLDGTRELMARREAEGLVREQERLGLTDDERILFASNRAAPLFWPIALASVSAVVASSLGADLVAGWRGFALLGLGLAGMLFLVTARDRVRYYLTTHRVLVRRRGTLGRDVSWTELRYQRVTGLEKHSVLGAGRIRVSAVGATAELAGLSRAQLGEVEAILDERLPAEYRSGVGRGRG